MSSTDVYSYYTDKTKSTIHWKGRAVTTERHIITLSLEYCLRFQLQVQIQEASSLTSPRSILKRFSADIVTRYGFAAWPIYAIIGPGYTRPIVCTVFALQLRLFPFQKRMLRTPDTASISWFAQTSFWNGVLGIVPPLYAEYMTSMCFVYTVPQVMSCLLCLFMALGSEVRGWAVKYVF